MENMNTRSLLDSSFIISTNIQLQFRQIQFYKNKIVITKYHRFVTHSDLEENLITYFNGKLKYWCRYVDDTFTIIKSNEVDYFLLVLNSYHKDIKFTYINWKVFAPKSWKIGTLKGLYRRVFLVSSDDNRLEKKYIYLSTSSLTSINI